MKCNFLLQELVEVVAVVVLKGETAMKTQSLILRFNLSLTFLYCNQN